MTGARSGGPNGFGSNGSPGGSGSNGRPGAKGPGPTGSGSNPGSKGAPNRTANGRPAAPAGASDAPGGRATTTFRAIQHHVHPFPRTFQGRLSLAFVLVFALAVGVVSALTLFILDSNLYDQELTNLASRARAVAFVTRADAETTIRSIDSKVVVSPSGALDPNVHTRFATDPTVKNYANDLALADLTIRFGRLAESGEFVPASGGSQFTAPLTDQPPTGQSRDSISYTHVYQFEDPTHTVSDWALEVSLSAPYTSRERTIAAVAGFLTLASLGTMLFAIVVASILARRFTAPLRRLQEAARALAEGNLDRRVPVDEGRTGTIEIMELSRQFNAMADRVQESLQMISRDRDRGREFMADVSHELRTPLAALRTFNELLQESAGTDAAARAEFLEASAQQIERLDWLAQNLLELSKLDSGLVRLDLRPEDLRTTVKSAVVQAEAGAERRGIALELELPPNPVRLRHDPQRIGQVVSNLVGNALKFTQRGGSVRVSLAGGADGARIEVADSGVGIDATELPHIFDRFYRGSRAHEARGSGSGLGLAIVRSIVEMHGGRVTVESHVGQGSRFTVSLPADLRPQPGDGHDDHEPELAAPALDRAGADGQPAVQSASTERPG